MFKLFKSQSEELAPPVRPQKRPGSAVFSRRMNISRVVSRGYSTLIVPGKEIHVSDKLRNVNELLQKHIQPVFEDDEGKLSVLVAEHQPGIALKRMEDLDDCTEFLVMDLPTFNEHFKKEPEQ
jgi:hypothetical protein